MSKSPQKICVTRYQQIIEYAIQAISDFRARGVKTEYAIPDVAELLNTSPTRITSLHYQQKMWGMREDEADRIERGFLAHADREIARAIERTEALKLRKYQAEMRLECRSQGSSARGFGLNATG